MRFSETACTSECACMCYCAVALLPRLFSESIQLAILRGEESIALPAPASFLSLQRILKKTRVSAFGVPQ